MMHFSAPLLSEWIFLYHHNEQQDQQYDKNYGLIPIFYYHGMYNTKK